MKSIIKNTLRKSHIIWLRHIASSSHEIQVSGRIVVVAPHPDDEVIGCGGLIARLVGMGNAPQIVVLTGGEGSHAGCCKLSDKDIKDARRRLTRDALFILGVPNQNIHELDYPDGGISFGNKQTDELKKLINQIQPQTVFVPHWGEGWPDHVKTAEIVKSLTQPGTIIYEYCVWMWYYNVWRGLDWKNAAVLKMSPEEHVLKLRAMDAYTKPLAPCGNPWSGILPPIFLKAHRGRTELYFRTNPRQE